MTAGLVDRETPEAYAFAFRDENPFLGGAADAGCTGVLKSRKELANALRDILSAGLWVAPEVVEAFWEGVGGRP